MALTLRDVVENRAAQRGTSVRRDAAATRDADATRRERFSLEDSDQRAAHTDRVKASANARTNTARPQAARRDSAASDTPKPAAAEPHDAKTDETVADQSEPQDDSVRTEVASPMSSDTGDAARSGSPTKPVPGKAALSGRSVTAKAGTMPPEAIDAPASERESAAPPIAAESGSKDEASVAKPDVPPTAAPPVMMAVFAAPPPIVPTPPPATAASGTGEAGESDGAVTELASKGVKDLPATTGPARGAPAAKPGFEAALAEIASAGPGADAATALTSQGAEPSAATGATTTTVQAPSEAKAATALQQPAPAAPASAPVPLGAVPMTIGLRALGASNRFEIRLDPKELGRIDVSIDIDKDTGTVGARLVVDRPETLALLQRDASSLQQALAQTGLDASAGVSLSLRSDSENRGEGRNTDADAQDRRGGRSDGSDGRESGSNQIPIDLVPLRALRGIGRVDIRI